MRHCSAGLDGSLQLELCTFSVFASLAEIFVVLGSGFALTPVDPHRRLPKAVVNLTDSVVNVTHDLDNLLWVPHRGFERPVSTSLALLTVEFELAEALHRGQVQTVPKSHAPFHGSPPVTARRTLEANFCRVFKRSPLREIFWSLESWHQVPSMRIILGK
jgi:hypothetical protein